MRQQGRRGRPCHPAARGTADRRDRAAPGRRRRAAHRLGRWAGGVARAVARSRRAVAAVAGAGRCAGRRAGAGRPCGGRAGRVGSPMATEHISPRYVDLDSWSTAEMIEAMYEGQLAAAAAVRTALKDIAAAVDDAVPALQRGGRLVYAGAGTSGRIGVQDGSELLPTYDWPSDRLVFLMAGGLGALVQSVEGAEDDEAEGVRAVAQHRIGADDVVIGIAASGTTPFTLGVLRAARAAGAVTIALVNNREAPLLSVARH